MAIEANALQSSGRSIITSEPLDSSNPDFKLDPPSALPAKVELVLLEEERKAISFYDEGFIEVSEKPGLTPKVAAPGPANTFMTVARFNTLDDAATREVQISGIELKFDGSSTKLGPFEEKPITDLTKISLYAHHVIIAKPLNWQGTDVFIYARKLTFRGDGCIEGCINTTPQAWLSQAFSVRQRNGRPIDANGSYLGQGQNGQSGQKAGDVYLFVKELDLGATAGKAIKRFICNGSAGQKGEPGGLKLAEKPDGTPFDPKNAPKNKKPIELEDVRNAICNPTNSLNVLASLGKWRFPNDSGNYTNDFYGGLKGREHFRALSVTDVRLVLMYTEVVFAKRKVFKVHNSELSESTDQTWTFFEGGLAGRNLPGNGEDAYPSGATGKGGDGGNIYVRADLASTLAASVTSEPGESLPSANVAGGPAGTPATTWYCDLVLYQDDVWNDRGSKSIPQVRYGEFRANPGKAVPGSAAGPGSKGSIKSDYVRVGKPVTVGANDWLRPEVLRPVLSFAEQAYRDGFRVQAGELVAPYVGAMATVKTDLLPPELKSCRDMLFNLSRNLLTADLDLYGHPPGWVPHFSAKTYLELYQVDRNFSYKFCYIMTKLLSVMEGVENASQVLEIAAGQSEAVIDRIHKDLGEGYKSFANARNSMDRAMEDYKSVNADLEKIQRLAQNYIEEAEKEKAIAKAVLQGVGSIAKAIPVYKPAFQIAGELLDKAGDAVDQIDPSEPDPGTNVLNFLEGFSKNAAKALGDNADTFKDQFNDTLKQKYKVDPNKEDLATKISQARRTLKGIEGDSGDAMKKANQEMLKDEVVKSAQAKADALLSGYASRNKQLSEEIAGYDALIKSADEKGSESEIASKTRQAWVARRLKLSTALAQNALVIGRAKAELKEVLKSANRAPEAITTSLKTAETNQKALQTANDKLEELLGTQAEAQAEEKIAGANSKFGAVLDGAQSLLTGMAKVSNSIKRLKNLNDPNAEPDAQIIKLRDQFLKRNSRFHKEYETVMETLAQAEKAKASAVRNFQASNDFVLKRTSDLGGALQTRVEVARNRMRLSLAINGSLKASLRDMQRSARERMEYYLYLFRKAYMYEQLVPVPEKMANVNQLIEELDKELQKLDEVKKSSPDKNAPTNLAAAANLAAISKLTEDKFGKLGDMVLTNILADLGRTILDHRSKTGSTKKLTYSGLLLSEKAREALKTKGAYAFPGVNILLREASSETDQSVPLSLEQITAAHSRVVISSIAMANDDVELECPANFTGPVIIEMTFGREFVLRGSDKKYYTFRIAEDEEPISYDFVVTRLKAITSNAPTIKMGTVTAAKVEVIDPIFKSIIEKENNVAKPENAPKVEYVEMAPSLYTSLTVKVGLNQSVKIRKLSPSIEVMWD